jgi:hypothetical protein
VFYQLNPILMKAENLFRAGVTIAAGFMLFLYPARVSRGQVGGSPGKIQHL